MNKPVAAGAVAADAQKTVFAVLFAISAGHFLNDLMQSVITASYPLLKENYRLSFTQVGIITLVFQLTASIFQPFVGNYTDKNPKPYAFAIAMCFSLAGILLLSNAHGFITILLAVSFIGIGSSIFHPEASKVAFLASGGKRGLAQSIFQLGGNGGSAMGPLLVAAFVIPFGQGYIAWFSIAALLAVFLLYRVGVWYSAFLQQHAFTKRKEVREAPYTRKQVIMAVTILLVLIFSKYVYMTSISSYLTFFLMDKFHINAAQSQFYLFLFLGASALGTLLGGPVGDRFGRKIVIWFSILGIAPFTLMLPYANLFWTGILVTLIGLILASAFSAILVYAQELVPDKVGMISGLFFGFAFGIAGIASALLGKLADSTSIAYVYSLCAYLPLIGLVTVFLPRRNRKTVH